MQRTQTSTALPFEFLFGIGTQFVFRERYPTAFSVISALMLFYPQFAYAVDIDDAITEPVTTSTIDGGAPGDVNLTENGSITFEDAANVDAVTMDSSNNVTIAGDISFNDTTAVAGDADNVSAIKVRPDLSGDILVSGAISLSEDYTREDEDDDGDEDGPLALGSNRYGLFVEDGGTLTGDIRFDFTSSLLVEGNDSIGVYLGSALDGNLELESDITVTGDNARGVDIKDGVTGNVLIGDTVSVQGENSTAVSVQGAVGGGLLIENDITGTGFTSTTATNYIAPANVTDDTPSLEDRLDADDLYDNQAVVAIGASIDGGLLINGLVDEAEDDDNDETVEDKNAIDDFNVNRGTGSISSFGSGPALLITPDWGGADADLVLGSITETIRDTQDDDEDGDLWEPLTISADGVTLAQFNFDEGFINRGTIVADGQNVGFEATVVSISGSADGLYTTTITNGVLNEGRMDARAFEANATAVHLGSGLQIGTFNNDGTIYAQSNYAAPLTDEGAIDATALQDITATGIQIEAGVNIDTIKNSGGLSAVVVGDDADAVSIRDLSGNVSLIENSGTIQAIAIDDDTNESGEDDSHPEFVGSTIAIDMSTHTADQGVRILQEATFAGAQITGDILFGAGDDTIDLLAGGITGDTKFGAGTATLNIADAFYTGDVTFGGDTATVAMNDARFNGALNFGSSTASFSLSNGSSFTGIINSESASIDMTIADSTLTLDDENAFTLQSLAISGETELGLDVRTNTSSVAPYITVLGDASVGAEVSIRPIVSGVIDADYSRTLIEATNLSLENVDLLINEDDLSWIYKVSVSEETGAVDRLVLNFAMKSGDEMGLDSNQTNALGAILGVAESEGDFGEELLSITDQNSFLKAYNLLLPQRTDASTRYLESQTNASFSALSERLALRRTMGERNAGFWTQEHFTHINVDADVDQPGYEGRGFGVSLGYDRRLGAIDAVGVMVSVSDGRFEEATGGVTPVSTTSYGFSGFVSESLGPLDIQLAGQYGLVSFNSTRNVVVGGFTSDVSGEWEGTSTAGSAVVSADLGSGAFSIRPKIALDFFALDQDGYTETATDGLNLSIGDASTDRTTASGGVAFGYHWNRRERDKFAEVARTRTNSIASSQIEWLAQAEFGYRDTLSSSPYQVTAQYVGFDETFELLSPELFGEAFTGGVSITGVGDLFAARLGVDTEVSDEAEIYTANVSVRFKF